MSKLEITCAIITSMLGLAYPLMLQAIERMDTKYNSQSLTSLLSNSGRIRFFQVLLLLNAILLFASGCSDDIVKLTEWSHFPLILTWTLYIATAVLLCTFYQSCSLIFTFYSTENLTRWFARKGQFWNKVYQATYNRKWLFLCEKLRRKAQKKAVNRIIKSVSPRLMQGWTGLMSSLLKNNEGNLIVDNYQFLTVRLFLIREMSGDSPVSYPDPLNKAVVDINSVICQSKERAFSLTCTNDLLISYAGAMDKKENSELTRGMIWRCLTEQIYRHREDLINSYWTYAVQRSALYLQNSGNRAYHKSYIEFHLLLGAHLLYHQRDRLLSEMLFKSQTYPPEYTLIPSNFSDVFEWFLIACRSPYEDNFYFESKYPFLKDQDALNSGIIRGYLRKYLSLLLLRLKYVPTFYVNDDVSVFNRNFEKTPRGIKQYMDASEALKKEVVDWLAQEERYEKLLSKHPFKGEMVDVPKLLNNYKEYLQKQAENIKESQTYSSKIIAAYQQTIVEQLKERIGEYELFLNSTTDIPSQVSPLSLSLNDASSKGIYPSSYFKEGQEIPVSGFDTALAQQVYMALQHHIATCFFAQRILKSVYADDVVKALDRLNPKPDRHIILCFGYDGYLSSKLAPDNKNGSNRSCLYKGVPFQSLPGSSAIGTFLLVIDKHKLPKIEWETPQLDIQKLFNYKEFSQLTYPLYWGLTNLNEDSELKTKLLEDSRMEASSLNDRSYLAIYLRYKLYIPEDCVLDGFQMVSPYSSKVNEVDKLKELV